MSGPLFVDSIGQITAPGVGAVDVQAPVVIEEIPNGKLLFAGQFDWGPINVAYEPTDIGDAAATYWPQGTPRTSSGYRALMRRKGLALAIVRVLHSDAVKATAQITATGGNVVATAKCEGTKGNNLVLTQAPASDGVAGHKKFTVHWTDPVTGTYTETIADNVAPPNATPVTFDVSTSRLVSSFTIDTAVTAFPVDADKAFGAAPGTAGADGGAITAADYNAAMDALDLIDNGTVMTTDDCGDGIRATVLANLHTHAVNAAGRYLVLLQGASGNAWSAVKTDKLTFTSKWALYFQTWAYVLDDAGVARLTPTTTFAGSAIINLEPQQSHAWAADQVTKYYEGVNSLYTAQVNPGSSSVQQDAMQLGIQLMQREPDGSFSFAHDRNCNTTLADRYTVTSRLRRFFGLGLTLGLRSWRNAPNITVEQRDLVKAMKQYMDAQVKAGRAIAYSLDPNSNNTSATVASGYFIVADSTQTPAPMERIAVLLKAAPTVSVETPSA